MSLKDFAGVPCTQQLSSVK